jgi:hypothetical protein
MPEITGTELAFTVAMDDAQLDSNIERALQRIKELREGAINGGKGMDTAFDTAAEKIKKSLGDVAEACIEHETAISGLEAQYNRLKKAAGKAFSAGKDDEYRDANKQMLAVQGEISSRKELLKQLRDQSDTLEKASQKVEENRQKTEAAANAQVSMRTRIKQVKEEMMLLIDQGIDEQSEAYKRLEAELGRLTDIQGDVAQQGKTLANDEAKLQGVISGLSGLAGGFSAVTGAVGLFSDENENLQKVMTRVQSVMAITLGMQQVAQALNKDSAFQLVVINGLKEWWRKVVTQATVAETAETAAINQNSVAQAANAAAQTAGTVAAGAATKANLTLAGSFRILGVAIKSIPGIGWIAAAIGVLIGLATALTAKIRAAKKEQEAFTKSIVEGLYEPVGMVENLAVKWSQLGDTLQAKQKFVDDNKEAFDGLGVSVRDVLDAENLLVKNKDKFIEAQIAKAKATAIMQMTGDKVKRLLEVEQALEAPYKQTSYMGGRVKGTDNGMGNRGGMQHEYNTLYAEIRKMYAQAAEEESNGAALLKEAGFRGVNEYAAGTVGAIEEAIGKEQAALKNLSDPKVYKIKLKQIAELQKLLDSITGGKTTGKSTDKNKDPFLEMLEKRRTEYARYYEWVNSGDEFITRTADEAFAKLLADGVSYIDFLKRERDKLVGENANAEDVANLSGESRKKLTALNNAIAQETEKTVVEEFSADLDKQLDKAESALDMLKIVAEKRKELKNDSSELDNKKKDVLDKAEKTAQTNLRKETAELLTEYASYTEKKIQLDKDYYTDLAILQAAYASATTDEDKAKIDKAIAARKKKYEKDSKSGGDEEYARMLEEYTSFEEKKQAIIEEFDEKRRVATEHGDTQLIERLNEAQKKALSKLGLDEVMTTDWSKMFGNLDEIATKELNNLLQKIENLDPAVLGITFNPEDLAKIKEAIGNMKGEIRERNPFAGLVQGIKDYQKAGDDAAKKKALQDSAMSTAAVFELASQMLKTVTNSLETLGVTMDEETQTVLNDVGGLLDGGAKLAEGIATGNPLAIIEGSIGVISNGIDLIWGANDRKANRSIRQHAAAVEKLETSYKELERVVNKALGTDVYKAQAAQIANLELQRKNLAEMARLESEKKKADQDTIKEYNAQIATIDNTIEDIKESMKESVMGGFDAKGIADQLGSAFIDAFEQGEDAAKAWGDTVNDIVRNVIKNMVIQSFLEKQVGAILKKYEDQWLDTETGVINMDKFAQGLPAMAEELIGVGDTFGNAMLSLPEKVRDSLIGGSTSSGTSGGLTGAIKGVSEETAGLVAGQMNAIRINQLESTQMLRQQLFILAGIERNTRESADNTRDIKDKLDNLKPAAPAETTAPAASGEADRTII